MSNDENIWEDAEDIELVSCAYHLQREIEKRGIEIYKMQLPMMGAPHALIYNEERTKEATKIHSRR